MKKKHRIDFILHENDYSKIVFRFRPDLSNCHSHNDEPPKSWNEVYKVYYYYEIIQKFTEDKERRVLWKSGCDECSIIAEVAYRILLFLKVKKRLRLIMLMLNILSSYLTKCSHLETEFSGK